MLYGVSFVAEYLAWNTSTGTYVTGDVANHTLRWNKDGTLATVTNSPAEIDAVNRPGSYKITMTATEAQCLIGTIGGKSATANVILIPTQYSFHRLPNVDPNTSGGLPTIDANLEVSSNLKHVNGTAQTAADLGVLPGRLTSTRATGLDNLDATVSSRSTYAGADTAGTTTLLGRLTATRATNLDNLDAAISGIAAAVWGATTRTLTAISDSAGITTLLGRLTALRATGLDNIDATVSSRLAAASYTAPDNTSVSAIKTKTDQLVFTVANRVDSQVKGTDVGTIDAAALATDAVNEITAAILASSINGTLTLQQFLKLIGAQVAGKVSGAGTTTITFRNVEDTANALVATVDANGNRSAVTITV